MLSEQICIEGREILRESDDEVDDVKTSSALENTSEKIPKTASEGRKSKTRNKTTLEW